MPKEYYSCPHCPQTSSRRWNLIVHLRRRHNGIGQPVVGTTTKLRYTNRMPTESQLQSSLFGRATGMNTKPLDFVNEELRKVAEYRRLIDEAAPPGRRSLDPFGWSLLVANSTSPRIKGRLPEYADVGHVSYICNRFGKCSFVILCYKGIIPNQWNQTRMQSKTTSWNRKTF